MRAAQGFTLIELLVAVSILGLLTVLGAGLFHMGVRSWNRVSEASEGRAAVEAVQTMLRREFATAIPAIRSGSASRLDFDGREQALEFQAPLPQALGGVPGALRLDIEEADGLRNLTLAWRRRGEQAWKRSVLLSRIKAAHYAYYGAAGAGKPPDWHSAWQNRATLPRAIRMKVEFPERDPRRWPVFIVAPLIDADVTCIYDLTSKKCMGR